MRIKRRPTAEISISFLDVISCGFGAIVLLLLIARTVEFSAVEPEQPEQGSLTVLQKQLFDLRGDNRMLQRELLGKQEQLSQIEEDIARLRDQLASVDRAQTRTPTVNKERDELALALQILEEEMARLLASKARQDNQVIGGIPVDSEYIVFIVDTSGSMFDFAWPKVRREMINILDIYPQVKGIQIMNDMGEHMFSGYRGRWIPDTPGRRKAIINRLTTWTPFSNSSPVEGIQRAIKAFYAPDKKISLYVFGDDFTGGSIRQVLDTVDRINAKRGKGDRLVRIHTVGFPVHFLAPGGRRQTATRFAALMRELSFRNDGTFVGLNSLN
ncbi:MAG TPA: hypothetical protein DCF62_14490 [Porticoccaceae bacterium]|nr:hypothetical protein [Porticoccaceae bacterium]HCO61679.1 hypothetical protein [Porticoccaceae bacterium]